MSESEKLLEIRLIQMVRSSPKLMDLLETARALKLDSWCIGAGAVRSLVWDRLHGFPTISEYEDVDVVYYDDAARPTQDAELMRQLLNLNPSVCWEVTNQAHIHHWFLDKYSQVVAPLHSLSDGIATWPEFATCVGVTLNSDDSIGVIAPHGLTDLFQLHVRHKSNSR